jgi:hypothetical protein
MNWLLAVGQEEFILRVQYAFISDLFIWSRVVTEQQGH